MRRAVMGVAVGLLVLSAHAEVSITPLGGDSSAAGNIPSVSEVQADFDDARYTLCLQKIDRALSAQPAPAAADRYQLLSLKGECLLHKLQAGSAAEAFDAAAAAATEKPQIATATATATLLQRSTNFEYAPVTGNDRKPQPLPLMTKSKRGPAMAALWIDEQACTKPLQDAAVHSTEIQPVLDFAATLHTLSLLELAGTHATPQTDALQKALTDHAHELVTGTIAQWNADADAIATAASKIVEIPADGNLPARRQRKGLTDADKQQLNTMITASDKLQATGKQLIDAYALDPDFFKDDLAAIALLQKRLHKMLVGIYLAPRTPTTRHAGSGGGNSL